MNLLPSPWHSEWLPARLALAAMAWLGFINLYMVRINLSVIIVAMVSRNATVNRRAPCLSLFNNTQGELPSL